MVYKDNKDKDSHLEVKNVMDFIFSVHQDISHLHKLFMSYNLSLLIQHYLFK